MTPTATPDAVAAVLDARADVHLVAELDQAQIALQDLRRALRQVLRANVLPEGYAEWHAAHTALCVASMQLMAARPQLVARFGEPDAGLAGRGRL